MRLCLPTTDGSGLTSRLSPHFGSAPFFTLVDTAAGQVEAWSNAHEHHEHGRCNPAKGLMSRDLDAVVCRGLGMRALQHLLDTGIPVLVTEAWTVAGALEAFHAGELKAMNDEEACAGRGHGHDHEPEEGHD